MKINKKTISVLAASAAMLLSLAACDTQQTTAQSKENKQASAGTNALLTNQPVHSYQYSQVRQNLQELEDAQAGGTVTTSFFMHMGMQDPSFTCPSIGAPIASTTQLTNPQQTVDGNYHDSAVINQMDPTGVYTGQSTGTYVMCVGANGQVNPVYWEGDVLVAFGPAHWDKASHLMAIDGPAGSKFTGIKK